MYMYVASCTDTLLNLCVIAEQANYLGISIVGQSNKGGDGGIYVGSIMKGYVPMINTPKYFVRIHYL